MSRPPERLEADDLIETFADPAKAAEIMAGEQSSGTFVPVPGETPELKARSAARVERLELLDEAVAVPSLPTTAPVDPAKLRRARVTLSWPMANLGPSLPNLLATVAGNLFELRQFTGLRVEALRLPQAFADKYPGPRFGVEGTRRLSGVADRPLIGTIVKPSVEFGPDETAALVEQLCAGGIDFIKDDELQADGPTCPFADRVRAVMAVINRHADRTGKKVMYAFNATGEIDEMRRRHDLLVAAGGTCIMASINSVGLAGMVDGEENPPAIISAAKLYEVQKYCLLTNHMWDGWWFLMNRRAWSSMPADMQEIFARIVNEAAVAERADIEAQNTDLKAQLAAKGLVFNDVDPAPFRAKLAASGFYKNWKDKFGPEEWDLLEQFTRPLG